MTLESTTLTMSNAEREIEQQKISFFTSKDENNKATLEDSSTASQKKNRKIKKIQQLTPR